MATAKVLQIWNTNATNMASVSDADYTMSVVDKLVEYTSVVSSRVLTLPKVVDAVGGIYVVHITGFTGNEVTVTRHGDDEASENILDDAVSSISLALAVDEEWVVLYSDGLFWHVLAKNIA